MRLTDLAKIIKPVARILGSAVPGGGVVTEILSNAFNSDNTPDAIAAAIEKDPNAAAKLLEIENAHKQTLERIALERDLAEIKDVQDARGRDIAIRQAGQMNWRADILAGLAIGGLITIIVLLVYRPLMEGPGTTLLIALAGNLASQVTQVYSFEFGSSRSSKQKDAIMASTVAGTGTGK